ncbi:MAG TPA: cytochrome b N-terminal domain-containing protein [Kofleriaceae bacterium]|jgi:ubiquinol-cytochrome c reductase cytochrome b subunit|nr:cytochrome b N-terminal domain-containing protein [Kofleriaceae bacterium]
MKDTIQGYLRERGLLGGGAAATIGEVSFAYAFGAVLVFLLVLQAVTGVALAAFYAPASTDAWASVAYIQDQVALGWFVRGVHHHGASALVIVTGVHLVQTAVVGAYKKPRELVWWLGLLLMVLILAWAVTGYVLRWDQAGFYANKVEMEITAATPMVGGLIKRLALGGNDYGNLTLTRFYALHVLILPVIVGAVTWGHVALSRKLGATPLHERESEPARIPRWPEQTLRNAIAIAMVLTVLLVYVVAVHGVELAAPADPSQSYDARPLWYFRWLFELRELAGRAEKIVALAVPAIVAGALVALPLADREPSRAVRRRLPYIGGLAGLCAVIAALTAASFTADARNTKLAERIAKADHRAQLARKLAHDNGVPATGAGDVFLTSPMARGRALYATKCKSCHDVDSMERKGPVIGPGHGSRDWLRAFVKNPSGQAFWGLTKLAKTDAAMKSFSQMPPADLDGIVELIYSESGATDVDADRKKHGVEVFEIACSDCHAREEGQPGSSAPGLAGVGTRAYYRSFISNPKSAFHMGKDKSQMPRFDKELGLDDVDALAEYLVWLRTATPDDIARLDPY